MMRNFLFFAACLPPPSSRDGGIIGIGIANAHYAFVPPHHSCSSSSSRHHHPMTSSRSMSRSMLSSSRSARRGDDRVMTRWRRISRTAAAAAAAVEGGEEGGGEISPDDYDLLPAEDEDVVVVVASREREGGGGDETTDLKRRLLTVAASYDRGFGSTSSARKEVDEIIRRLEILNPTKENASRGIDGREDGGGGDGDDDVVPLRAVWRMVWTSAYDVISLGGSPFAAPSAIYQDIRNPPNAINVIDFIPRIQSLLPFSISPQSLLRAKVATRASSRTGNTNRVGLRFEGLVLQPIELFGRRVDDRMPPLSVNFTFPGSVLRRLVELVPGLDASKWTGDANDDAPGYFDVIYLDEELLIIRQQAPGGVFALVKVDSCDP